VIPLTAQRKNMNKITVAEYNKLYILKTMAKAKLGSGARFKTLAKKVGSPALAAFIGRKKYGAKKFASLSAKGRKK